jgi:PhnB protein
MSFHTYLFFTGTCRQAFTRYQEIFGGELEIMSSADAPPGEEMPPSDGEFVMHAALTGGDQLLMGSDDPTSTQSTPVQGMMVNYAAADPEDAKRVFDALAEGGTVTMPLSETFFSPAFGMCIDAFDKPWMVSTNPAS